MSTLAASGGYYIAMDADRTAVIVTSPGGETKRANLELLNAYPGTHSSSNSAFQSARRVSSSRIIVTSRAP